MVCVNCLTYNHSAWIKDAMDSFCMQETSFPYVCTIVDDYSNDGEQEIIRSYIVENFNLNDAIYEEIQSPDYNLIFAQHKSNKNCFFVVYFLNVNHYQIKKSKRPYFLVWMNRSKYVAMCEGDDYWLDSQKLEKQVVFLEAHPQHTLCIHSYRRDSYYNDDKSSTEIYKYPHNLDIIPDIDVLCGAGMFAATSSMIYRAKSVEDYPKWARLAPVSDRALQLLLFSRGYIGYLHDLMSVYRVGVPGSWTMRINRNRRENRQNTKRFIQMYYAFDEWSEKKYHSLVRYSLFLLRIRSIKNLFLGLISRSYHRLCD